MVDVAATGATPIVEREDARPAGHVSVWRRVAARLELREVLGYDFLSLLALSGLAVAQPLLDLFGKNPEFFVAAEATRAQIVAFGLAVAFGVPLLAVVVELVAHAVGHRVGAAVHTGLVALLGTAFGATVARQFDFSSNLPVVAVSLAVGVAIAVAERRTKAMRLGLRYLALAPVLFLALFLLTSGTSRLLWEDEAEAATGVAVADPRPIVLIVFDELPVASLLGPDGQIDETRFPNFARLAQHSTWFRNATALSPNTPGSVPTIQSGLNPASGALPTSVDYPRNLFTLLGGAYDLDVTETITQVCPSTLCTRPESATDQGFLHGLTRTLEDASIVYGHATLPPSLREDLPGVDQSWGGFLEEAADATDIDGNAIDAGSSGPSGSAAPVTTTTFPEGITDFMAARNQAMAADLPEGTGAPMAAMIDRIGPEDESRLYFVHDGLFPHFNWRTTPDGRTYPGEGGPPGSVDGRWGANEFLIREGQQRHLLQVGYADTLLGELMDRLEEQGVWDDAMIVVTADHGIAFTADHDKRAPSDETVDEIYRVPMFIRVPGEREGEVDDGNALNTDVLPTIVDVLGIDTDWDFDGRSLIGDEPPPDDKPVFYGTGPSSVSTSLDGLFQVAARNHERFDEPGWDGVVAVGGLGRYVGRLVSSMGVTPVPEDVDADAAWRLQHPERFEAIPAEGGRIPLVVEGSLDLEPGHEPADEALVALNGTVAGVAGDFHEENGRWHFRALLDYRLFTEGDHEVALLIVGRGGDEPTFYEVPRR